MESYRTLMNTGGSEIVEKRSRFLGYAVPAKSRQEAEDFFLSVRAKHKDASHNVSAYSIRKGGLTHAGDDGEPSGTAGMPVLDALLKADILDAAVVVTRYFGGTLLGTGGLRRAYSAAAAAAVKDAGIAVMTGCCVYAAALEYPLFEPFKILLKQCGARMDDAVFTEKAEVVFTVKQSSAAALLKSLRELTRGAVSPRLMGERFEPLSDAEE